MDAFLLEKEDSQMSSKYPRLITDRGCFLCRNLKFPYILYQLSPTVSYVGHNQQQSVFQRL